MAVFRSPTDGISTCHVSSIDGRLVFHSAPMAWRDVFDHAPESALRQVIKYPKAQRPLHVTVPPFLSELGGLMRKSKSSLNMTQIINLRIAARKARESAAHKEASARDTTAAAAVPILSIEQPSPVAKRRSFALKRGVSFAQTIVAPPAGRSVSDSESVHTRATVSVDDPDHYDYHDVGDSSDEDIELDHDDAGAEEEDEASASDNDDIAAAELPRRSAAAPLSVPLTHARPSSCPSSPAFEDSGSESDDEGGDDPAPVARSRSPLPLSAATRSPLDADEQEILTALRFTGRVSPLQLPYGELKAELMALRDQVNQAEKQVRARDPYHSVGQLAG